MTRKIAIALVVLGIFGLVLSFRVLIREQWGAVPFSAGGVICLAVGSMLYWLSSRNAEVSLSGAERERTSSDDTKTRPQWTSGVFYLVLTGYLAVTIFATVSMVSNRADPGGLIFLWLLFVSFAVFALTRRILLKDRR